MVQGPLPATPDKQFEVVTPNLCATGGDVDQWVDSENRVRRSGRTAHPNRGGLAKVFEHPIHGYRTQLLKLCPDRGRMRITRQRNQYPCDDGEDQE